MSEVLVIEDDLTFSKILEGFLSKQGYGVTLSHNQKDGMQCLQQKTFQIVLLDYRLPDTTGLDALHAIKSAYPLLPVIIMTSFSDVRTAVKAIKSGAFEYITKPVNPDELSMLMHEALHLHDPDKGAEVQEDFITGNSPVSHNLEELLRAVAPTDLSVIIEGESGTGKERIARSIHKLSKRSQQPFVAVDCGTLSEDLAASELFGHVKGAFTGAMRDKEGKFAAAHTGTLFLDEIGNLSYEVQVKLLRAIQERVIQPVGSNKEVHIDVRIIAATNDDLSRKVKALTFREDLFHRINEFNLYTPSLRDRKEDLIHFVDFFKEKANIELGRHVQSLSPYVLDIFMRYDWPGNLRELKNTVKRAVLLTQGKVIEQTALPSDMIASVEEKSQRASPSENVYDLKALQELHERKLILKTLEEVRYNKSKAAKLLNIDRTTLYLKMEKYGIK